MILQLSWRMRRRVERWRALGNEVDWELLSQCAYYPRGGCQKCSFSNPNKRCKRSHILLSQPPHEKRKEVRERDKKTSIFGKDLEEVLRHLNEEDRKRFLEVLGNLVRR